MAWHAEPITLTLRRYADGDSYARRDKFASVATAQLLGGKRAYISGFLSDGTRAPIHKRDWLDLGMLLRDKYGIEKIESERHAVEKSFDTQPAPLI
nr:hypothetical protein [uncultured Albidiferax sp.]